jgi:surface antigen
LILSLIASGLSGTTVYIAEHWANPVHAEVIQETPEESIEDKAKTIAEAYGVSFDIMNKIIENESKWNPDAIGDNDNSYGLIQIHLPSHPEITKEQALNPEFALDFLAKEIKAGREWQWTSCNCYSVAMNKLGKLPKMANIVSNSNYPRVGGLIIFNYSGLKHIAVIESVEDDGIHVLEGNYKKCEIGRRVVKFDDHSIIGYWKNVE